LAGAEAERALNPHIRNAFSEIQRWYERLAAMEAAEEERRFEHKRQSDLMGAPREDGRKLS
jgi:hypothetical protein